MDKSQTVQDFVDYQVPCIKCNTMNMVSGAATFVISKDGGTGTMHWESVVFDCSGCGQKLQSTQSSRVVCVGDNEPKIIV